MGSMVHAEKSLPCASLVYRLPESFGEEAALFYMHTWQGTEDRCKPNVN